MASDPRPRLLDLRLLPAALLSWGLAAASQLGWGLPGRGLAWGCLGAAVLALVAVRRVPSARLRGWLLGLSLCAAVAGAAAGAVSWHAEQPMARTLATAQDGSELMVHLRRTGPPREVAGRFGTRHTAPGTVVEARSRRTCTVVQGRRQVTLWWTPPKHRSGASSASEDTVPEDAVATVRIRHRPGLVDLTVVSARGVPGARPSDPGVLEQARRATAARARRLGDRDVGALVTGMAYGDDSALDQESRDAMKATGLTHLTAVSGSNVALAFLIGRHLVLWLRGPRLLPIGAGLACVGAYVLLVGPEPSILRAAVMGTLGALAVGAGRGGSSGTPLWTAVIVLVLADPTLSVQAGFLLSVLATAGIVVSGPATTRCLALVLPRVLAEALALTLVATLWCTPYLLLLSGAWGPWSILANLAAAPVVPWSTATGILAVCCSWCGPVADVLVHAAGLGAWWVEAVGTALSSWPGARAESTHPGAAAALAAVLCLAASAGAARADPARRPMMDSASEPLGPSLARSAQAGREARASGRAAGPGTVSDGHRSGTSTRNRDPDRWNPPSPAPGTPRSRGPV